MVLENYFGSFSAAYGFQEPSTTHHHEAQRNFAFQAGLLPVGAAIPRFKA
jgi:hypothetical protein